jgi:hypothetical protein
MPNFVLDHKLLLLCLINFFLLLYMLTLSVLYVCFNLFATIGSSLYSGYLYNIRIFKTIFTIFKTTKSFKHGGDSLYNILKHSNAIVRIFNFYIIYIYLFFSSITCLILF